MSTPATARAILDLPDEALVPVAWVRPLLEKAVGGECGGVGYTVAELASKVGRARSTVRTWCHEGRLPGACRLRGREWRIPGEAFRHLLDGDAAASSGDDRLAAPRGGLRAWRGEQSQMTSEKEAVVLVRGGAQ